MIPPAFDYLVPATLPEAIALLHEHGDEAKVLAGGTIATSKSLGLMPKMKMVVELNHHHLFKKGAGSTGISQGAQ